MRKLATVMAGAALAVFVAGIGPAMSQDMECRGTCNFAVQNADGKIASRPALCNFVFDDLVASLDIVAKGTGKTGAVFSVVNTVPLTVDSMATVSPTGDGVIVGCTFVEGRGKSVECKVEASAGQTYCGRSRTQSRGHGGGGPL